MLPHANLRRAALLMAFCALVLLEVALLEGFLPANWPHPIAHLTEQLVHSPVYAPHPNMAHEFDVDFRQHPWHLAIAEGALALACFANVCLIVLAWRTFIRLKRSSPSPRSR